MKKRNWCAKATFGKEYEDFLFGTAQAERELEAKRELLRMWKEICPYALLKINKFSVETMEIKLEVKYEAGHSYQETWTKETYYCPCCGIKDVWGRHDGGDYYQGENFLCASCAHEWNWPNELCDAKDWQYKQRLEVIRTNNRDDNDKG